MSLKKIAALCKSRHKANLWNVVDSDGCVTQWIFCNDAAYPVGNVPFFEVYHIPALLSLSEKDLERVVIGDEEKPKQISLKDQDDSEIYGEMTDITIDFGGKTMLPILFNSKTYFIDADLLKPISARCKDPEFYLRKASDTLYYIAVKNGLLLVGIIFPMMEPETLIRAMTHIIEGFLENESEGS